MGKKKNNPETAMANTMLPPLSPLAQYMNTPVLTVYILGVCELEIPFNRSQAFRFLENEFLPLSRRLFSVIVTDEKGVQRWKEVDCKVEDHVVIPMFSGGLTPEDNDRKLEDYISDIYMEQLSATQPPWQVHLFNYPTSNAATQTILFKFSHALGDGYSFMGALLTLFKTAANPSVPVKFPGGLISSKPTGLGLSSFVYNCINTCTDLTRRVFGTYMGDDNTALRSKTPMVEYAPVNISSMTFSLDHVGEVKSKVGATVNEVMTGVLAYALQLYAKRQEQKRGGCETRSTTTTAVIVMNLRASRGFKNIEEMLKASIWGNHFGFLRVSLPSFSTDVDNVDPLEYISESKNEINRKRNSMSICFTRKLLNILRSLKGPQEVAKYVHSNLRNSSIMISNMVGPVEKVSLAGHSMIGFYFTIPGIPQSLVFTLVSYMGNIRMVASSERDYIDSQLLMSCLKEAFTNIYVAAMGEYPVKIQ